MQNMFNKLAGWVNENSVLRALSSYKMWTTKKCTVAQQQNHSGEMNSIKLIKQVTNNRYLNAHENLGISRQLNLKVEEKRQIP